MRRGKKSERIERKKRGDARKRRETWPTGSCSSRSTGFAVHKTNNKIWNTGRRPRVPVIFQGRQEDVPTYEETRRGRSRSRVAVAIGPEGKVFRIARSSLANVTSRWGVERCAGAHAGGPLVDSLGVSLGAEGPLEILSCNGVDVTPVERVQRWEDTLWKARLAIAPLRIFGTCFSLPSPLPPPLSPAFPLSPLRKRARGRRGEERDIPTPAKRPDGRRR